MSTVRALGMLAVHTICLALLPGTIACTNKGGEGAGSAASDSGQVQQGGAAEPNAAGPATSSSPSVAIPKVAPTCTNGSADVTVTVTSKQGPLGGTTLTPFTSKHLSLNLDDLAPSDYSPSQNATFVAYMKALKPGMLRWPDGYDSQTYQFSATATSPNGTGGGRVLTTSFLTDYLALCEAVGAEPYIGINTLSGTAANAAELVTWLNKTKGKNVRYFHIGNEPDVDATDATDAASKMAAYVTTFQQFRSAMLAVDGNLKLTGAELMTGANCIGAAGSPNWLAPILAGTKATPMDAIGWHYYPKDSSQTLTASSAYPSPTNLLLEDASDWPPAGLDFAQTAMPLMRQARDALAPKAEIWIDEFAEDSGKANGTGLADRAVGALWVADALGRYAEQGAAAIFRFIYKTGDEHGYALLDQNNTLRPDYCALWLYANTFGDQLVASKSSAIASVAVHAATRSSDGSLRVMLINKATTAKTVALTLSDFAPTASGRYLLAANAYLDSSMTLNGGSLTPSNIGQGEAAVAMAGTADACTQTVVTLPPVSIAVYAFAK